MIALQTGGATAPDHWRAWEPARRPADGYWPEAWRPGQSLASAFGRSAAWYLQDVAVEVGGADYRVRLADRDTGNARVQDWNDSFRLGGPLAISPREQVTFLAALLRGVLDVEAGHFATLADGTRNGTAGACSVHARPGRGRSPPAAATAPLRAGMWAGAPGPKARRRRSPKIFRPAAMPTCGTAGGRERWTSWRPAG
ncbi:hypothetical protein DXV76_06045 [Rhodobacteraceae bacterium CCMM004]|nr:hypothetical protein DXV76_06045 [Rhodobacteraceae bacterium CCMM004]